MRRFSHAIISVSRPDSQHPALPVVGDIFVAWSPYVDAILPRIHLLTSLGQSMEVEEGGEPGRYVPLLSVAQLQSRVRVGRVP